MIRMLDKSYSEMIQFPEYAQRLDYLKLLDNHVDSPRHISEDFFKSAVWLQTRRMVIDRDQRFDLGIFGMYIDGSVYVHHINPITYEDILNMTDRLLSMENLVCTSLDTHNAIHYKQKRVEYIERTPGDTKLW